MTKILLLLRLENTVKENKYYIEAIEKFGGEVVLVRDDELEQIVLEKLSEIDGILLTGGNDVGRLDFFLIAYAIKNNLKILGICQGMQSLALYNTDNKLIDIGNESHHQSEGYVHKVYLSDSKLKDIVLEDALDVNSHHKQKVIFSKEFRIVGRSADNLIEAIESYNDIFQIGVQWHPERMLSYDDKSNRLIKAFIDS